MCSQKRQNSDHPVSDLAVQNTGCSTSRPTTLCIMYLQLKNLI